MVYVPIICVYKSWHTLHSYIVHFIWNHMKTHPWAIQHVCGSQKNIALKRRTFWRSSKTQLWLIGDDCMHHFITIHYIYLDSYCIHYVPFNTAEIRWFIEGCLIMSASLSTSKRQSLSSEWHYVWSRNLVVERTVMARLCMSTTPHKSLMILGFLWWGWECFGMLGLV